MFIPACDRSLLQLSHSITMFPLVLFCGLPVTTFSCSARCLGRVWAAAPTGRGARLSFLGQNLGKHDVPVGRPRTPWRGVNAPWWRNAPCGNDGVSRQSGPRVGACSSLGTASGCFCLLGRRDPGTRTEGKWRASEAYARGRSDEAACVPAARLTSAAATHVVTAALQNSEPSFFPICPCLNGRQRCHCTEQESKGLL